MPHALQLVCVLPVSALARSHAASEDLNAEKKAGAKASAWKSAMLSPAVVV